MDKLDAWKSKQYLYSDNFLFVALPIPLQKFDRHNLSSRKIAILDPTSGSLHDSIHYSVKCIIVM